MGTKILNDIHNDLKSLITSITNFNEGDEGFNICERFVISNIKHHRYLSVDSHATKEAINALIEKFYIHGKYNVATKFRELVDTFLESCDFENHPQYDLQWSLLTLMLDLAKETNNSNLDCLKSLLNDYCFNVTTKVDDEVAEVIDWKSHLKEGQANFFSDYQSDTECEWSNDSEKEDNSIKKIVSISPTAQYKTSINQIPLINQKQVIVNKITHCIDQRIKSNDWLLSNVQNSWWKEIEWRNFETESKLLYANFCKIWSSIKSKHQKPINIISEYEASREILWMFQIQTSSLIFQYDKNLEFDICSNISVPSLTSTAFKSFLDCFCKHFSMLHNLNKFKEKLYKNYKSSQMNQKPPLTYEAYNSALQMLLLQYREEIVEIEKKIMQQSDISTLLTLSQLLKKRLNSIKIIYDIHVSVTKNWKIYPKWKCSANLLSSLYFQIQNSCNLEKTNICAYLYIKSLSVYLNIIDTWLTEGRFEDWRDEFLIMRQQEISILDDGDQSKRFLVRDFNDISTTDPIMQSLLYKVQNLGLNIELLVSLDRISDMWKNRFDQNQGIKISLYDEFCNTFQSEILKYINCDVSDGVDQTNSTENLSLYDCDLDIEKNVIEQLSVLNNPFLTKALESFMSFNVSRGDIVDASYSQSGSIKKHEFDFFKWINAESQIILPWRKLLENILSKTLDTRYSTASEVVKTIMVQEYKLESHLKLMRFVYMMETGHVLDKFNQSLFYEVESNQSWNNSYFLTCILEEILSQQWPDSSSRWSIKLNDIHTNQVLHAVDAINLHYNIGWPVNLVLNEDNLKKYNDVFRFQLKLKWALWTLNNLSFKDLEDTKTGLFKNSYQHFYIKRLECLRFWLLHAIGSIHAYLSGQVLQNLGYTLDKALIEANSLDKIIFVHNEYLIRVHEHCLLTDGYEDLSATINNIINMCGHVRNYWSRNKLLSNITELDLLERNYVKYHTFLALALHNAVQNKDADYFKLVLSNEHIGEKDHYDNKIVNALTEFGRTLLCEIGYQNFPPSGI